MGQWKFSIDVSEEWDTAEACFSGNGTGQAVIKKFIDELRKLPQDTQQSASDLVPQLMALYEEHDFDNDIFNAVWQEVYDWADANRVWVQTIASRGEE